jgi:hypothetical protein
LAHVHNHSDLYSQLRESDLTLVYGRLVTVPPRLDRQNEYFVRERVVMIFFISRVNSNARLQGFEQDLHLEGQQYATVLSILFVGYTTMQVPA